MTLSLAARIYVTVLITTGLLALLLGLQHWDSQDLIRFAAFASLAIPASCLKIKIPSVSGTMSVSFMFVLAGVVQLSLGETLVIGSCSVLLQCIWQAKVPPKPVQLLFNVASMCLAVTLSHRMYFADCLRNGYVQEPLRLVLAASALFAANTLPVSIAIALTSGQKIRSTWRDCYLWSFPYYLVGGGLVGIFSFIHRIVGWQGAFLLLPVLFLIYRSYRLYIDRLESEMQQAEQQRQHAEEQRKHAEQQERHAQEMASLHLRTIQALALAIGAKDQTTHAHLQRVQIYAMEVGKELGLSALELEALRAASLLHDIGKLAVPEHIISKPGKLTHEEFEKMKIHPVVGAEILESVAFPYPVVPIVRSHHEKWNGQGYPDGLAGEQIPLGARILSAVDCLDALASDRQYRRALPLDQAMAVVISESGKSFDARVVEILQRRYRELEQMTHVAPVELTKLSVEAVVERGDSPAAGFEQSEGPAASSVSPSEKVDFLTSIAAARQEVQDLFELSQDLGNSLSLNDTLSMLASRLKRMVPHDGMAVYLRQQDYLHPEFVVGDDARLFSSLLIPLGQGLSGWVAENKKSIINGNPSVEPGYLNDAAKFSTLRSALSVPLEGTDGVVGVLTLYHVQKDVFTKDHLRMLLAISAKLALSIENTLKFRQAEDSATTDYLTDLPNARSLFLHLSSEVARCESQNLSLTVLVGDLNGFKQVNDRLGHLEGNRVLVLVAKALRETCRASDYVARMGGDEFVVVLPELSHLDAEAMRERFCAGVESVCRREFGEQSISLSLGQAHYPTDGKDAEQLLAEADRAMYKTKRAHKQERQTQLDLQDSLLALARSHPERTQTLPPTSPECELSSPQNQ